MRRPPRPWCGRAGAGGGSGWVTRGCCRRSAGGRQGAGQRTGWRYGRAVAGTGVLEFAGSPGGGDTGALFGAQLGAPAGLAALEGTAGPAAASRSWRWVWVSVRRRLVAPTDSRHMMLTFARPMTRIRPRVMFCAASFLLLPTRTP